MPTLGFHILRINTFVLTRLPNSNVRYNYPKTVLAWDIHRRES